MYEPLMTVEEVAILLNISEQTLRKYIRNKEIKAVKFKRTYRITSDSVLEFINQRQGQ